MFPLFYSDNPLPDAKIKKNDPNDLIFSLRKHPFLHALRRLLDIVSDGFGMVSNSSLVPQFVF